METFFYTYVLLCHDGNFYIGYSDDLKKRLADHRRGQVKTTSRRLPIQLIYFEACRSEEEARKREQQLKSGYGRAYLKRRLAFELPPS